MTHSFAGARRDAIAATLRSAGCVFAHDEADLLIAQATTAAELDAMVERRAGGLPLEHVLGWAEFCDLRVAVDAGVFVPRHRTELLAREAIALAKAVAVPTTPVVLDLCCGAGAIGAALAAAVHPLELHAADVDPAAVRNARRNLEPLGGRVYEGDLYDALPADLHGRVHVLVANVPYVPTAAIASMPAEAREHEPAIALDGGADGLDVLRRVVAGATHWLTPGGHTLFETGAQQVPAALVAIVDAGLHARVAHDAELEATIVVGTAGATHQR